jgi:phosphatidylglycerol:prolipoprotein diacylglycerol transferase
MFQFFPSRNTALIVGGFSIYWYGLLYFAAFILALFLLPRLQRYRQVALISDDWGALLSFVVLGVIVGGRLGFCLLYDPVAYFKNPLAILAIRDGGMSFHGGLIGVSAAIAWFAWARGLHLLDLTDIATVPAAIGLIFGRYGNFLNQELYGVQTTLPWGMKFAGATGYRHPLQLYAMAKDAFISACCFTALRMSSRRGLPTAVFLCSYAVLRFALEVLREQQYTLLTFLGLTLTRGQWYCVPMFISGILLGGFVMRIPKAAPVSQEFHE